MKSAGLTLSTNLALVKRGFPNYLRTLIAS